MKKGFTLVELLAVIVFLALVALITVPLVANEIKKAREDVLANQIDSITQGASAWVSDNKIYLYHGESFKLNLYMLKQDNYVSDSIINAMTDKEFANNSYVLVSNTNGAMTYQFIDDGTDDGIYNSEFPIIKGDYVEIIELGETFTDFDSMEGLSTQNSKLGVSYEVVGDEIIYTTNLTTKYVNVIKSLIYRDTKGPEINFSGPLSISASQVTNYNLLSGVTVTDASLSLDNINEDSISIEVANTLTAVVGEYTLRYEATDIFGNKTVAYRDVVVN